jgi:hypothetical protein
MEFSGGDYFEIINSTSGYAVDVGELHVHASRIGGEVGNL